MNPCSSVDLGVPKNLEETNLKEQAEEYRKLALSEMSQLQEGLSKAENELLSYKNRKLPSIELSEEQKIFLSERPDYIEYLNCVKKFHDGISLIDEKEFEDMKAQLLIGREAIKNMLKKIHNL